MKRKYKRLSWAIGKIPGKFGSPYRYLVTEEQNKMQIYTLGLDSSGKLSNQSSNTLKA